MGSWSWKGKSHCRVYLEWPVGNMVTTTTFSIRKAPLFRICRRGRNNHFILSRHTLSHYNWFPANCQKSMSFQQTPHQGTLGQMSNVFIHKNIFGGWTVSISHKNNFNCADFPNTKNLSTETMCTSIINRRAIPYVGPDISLCRSPITGPPLYAARCIGLWNTVSSNADHISPNH